MTADIKINQNNSDTTNVWRQANLNFSNSFESSVGELKKGDSAYDETHQIYLEYPGLTDLIKQAKDLIDSNNEVIFETSCALPDTRFDSENLFAENKDRYSNRTQFSGVNASPFSSLLTLNYSGQKVLGSFTVAFIEAKAGKEAYGTNSIDHFYLPEGICHLSVLEDAIKAYEICKNDVVVMVIPDNAVKAFRRTRFSGWQVVETKTQDASIGKVFLADNAGNKLEEIKVIETEILNLDSPLYKVKIGERWVLVATQKTDCTNLNKALNLSINSEVIDSLRNNNKIEHGPAKPQVKLNTSLGQAVRTVFNLIGGDFDFIPEALLNFEGGSWSSIATEKASSGRHCGTNSMHEVIKHQWYKHPEVAIPWNYLSFDSALEVNSGEGSYKLSLENNPSAQLIECPQYWKKLQQELLVYVSRFVYREFAAIGSKKFLLSTKELMQISTQYLAALIKADFNLESETFLAEIDALNIQKDLKDFLKTIGHLHLMFSAKADFYSSKNHPQSTKRLHNLAKIEKALEKLCPASVGNFKNKVRTILDKDIQTEGTTLLEIYSKQL